LDVRAVALIIVLLFLCPTDAPLLFVMMLVGVVIDVVLPTANVEALRRVVEAAVVGGEELAGSTKPAGLLLLLIASHV
jgi:hypothetical protein